ncbi:MAG: hypothetical protein KJN99_02645, partial [Marinicaulis sp.]|nr:hypothetical protein [Marinicaulis sp.]
AKSSTDQPNSKFLRDMEKKKAVSDHEKARRAKLKNTERLRELRLAKEAEEAAAEEANPTKKKKTKRRSGLPPFVPEVDTGSN